MQGTLNGTNAETSEKGYRTISEVADALKVQPHVLRFWESKFRQVQPLKRRGNRRYYSLKDVEILSRIRNLLYNEGYTIKGVQKILKRKFIDDAEPVQDNNPNYRPKKAPPQQPSKSVAATLFDEPPLPLEPAGFDVITMAEIRHVIGELKNIQADLLNAAE